MKNLRFLVSILFVFLLGCQSNTKTTKELIQDLKSNDWLLQRNAIEALGNAGSRALHSLTDALKDKDPKVRLHATEAISLLGQKASKATKHLISLLKDKSPKIRRKAAQALGELKKDASSVLPTLNQHQILDQDPLVRLYVIRAITQIDPTLKGSIPALKKRLADTHPLVVLTAAKALANKGKEQVANQALQKLSTLLQHKDTWIRANAAFAMQQIGAKAHKAIQPLIVALKDKSPFVRQNAADALGSMGRSAVDSLKKQLQNPSARMRYYIVYALGKIGKQGASAEKELIALAKREHEKLVKQELKRTINRVQGKGH